MEEPELKGEVVLSVVDEPGPAGIAEVGVGMACRELEVFPSVRDAGAAEQDSLVGSLASEVDRQLVEELGLVRLVEEPWLVRRQS